METLVIKPENVCCRQMTVEVEDGVVKKITPVGGCQGNLTGVCTLCVGMKVKDVIAKLEGIQCRGSRTGATSCPDQLAKGLKQLLK